MVYRLHGHTTRSGCSRTYRTWLSMRARCLNPGAEQYQRYGARGITICDRWESFEAFLADMGERPEGMTLDRLDSNGPYSKENCRWATNSQQARNRRSSRIVEFRGQTKTLVEWCEYLGLDYPAVRVRLQNGWTMERALTTPVIRRPRRQAA